MSKPKIGKKEMQVFQSAAMDYWKNNPHSIEIDKEDHSLEKISFLIGAIALLNDMGLLKEMPEIIYTKRGHEPLD